MIDYTDDITKTRESSENVFRIFPGQRSYVSAPRQRVNPFRDINKNDFAIMQTSSVGLSEEEEGVQTEIVLESNLIEQFCSLALAFPVHRQRLMPLLDSMTNEQISAALNSSRFRDGILSQILEKSNGGSNVLDFIARNRGVILNEA